MMKLKRIASLILVLVFSFALVVSASASEEQDPDVTFVSEDTIQFDAYDYTYLKGLDHLDRFHPEICYYRDAVVKTYEEGEMYDQRIYTDENVDFVIFAENEAALETCNFSVYAFSYSYYDAAETKGWELLDSYVILADGWESAAYYPEDEIKTDKINFVSVASLKVSDCYPIFAYYDNYLFVRNIGAIYAIGEEYWYVSYEDIDAECFDENGNLNYSQNVDVKAKRLKKSCHSVLEETLESPIDMQMVFVDDNPSFLDLHFGEILFFLGLFFWGIFIPVGLLVMGIIFTCSKKIKSPRRWFIFSLLCGLWIFLSILIVLVLLL